jgi:hypothetical protein
MVLNPMQKSPAWLDLSGNAVKLLLHLMMLSQGNNGWGHKDEQGELFLGERDAAAGMGVSRNTASRAFEELVDHGFLRAVRIGHFQVKLKIATVWRLTFQPYPRLHQGPTNEWRKWRPEQNSRAQNLTGTGAKIGHGAGDQVATGAKSDPVKLGNGGKRPTRIGPKSEPHLDIPRGCGASERGSAWWGADARLHARVSSHLATLAWLSGSLEKLSNNQSVPAATSLAA